MTQFSDNQAKWSVNQRKLFEDLLEAENIRTDDVVGCPCRDDMLIVDTLRKNGIFTKGKSVDSSYDFVKYLNDENPDIIITKPSPGEFFEISNLLPISKVKKAFLLAPLSFAVDQLIDNPSRGRYPPYGLKRISRLTIILRPVTSQPTGLNPDPRSRPYAWFVFERGHIGAPVLGWI